MRRLIAVPVTALCLLTALLTGTGLQVSLAPPAAAVTGTPEVATTSCDVAAGAQQGSDYPPPDHTTIDNRPDDFTDSPICDADQQAGSATATAHAGYTSFTGTLNLSATADTSDGGGQASAGATIVQTYVVGNANPVAEGVMLELEGTGSVDADDSDPYSCLSDYAVFSASAVVTDGLGNEIGSATAPGEGSSCGDGFQGFTTSGHGFFFTMPAGGTFYKITTTLQVNAQTSGGGHWAKANFSHTFWTEIVPADPTASAGLQFSDGIDHTKTPDGEPSTLGISPLPSAVAAGAAVPLTISMLDNAGQPIAAGGQTPVALASSSSTGTFALTPNGAPVSSVDLTGSSATVYYADPNAGQATLSASTPGLGSATQPVNIASDPVAPGIVSSPAATVAENTPSSFTIDTTGTPTPAIALTGALPTGMAFQDNGDGTATISGTPAVGSAGSYPVTIDASNGSGPDATQSLTLTVTPASAPPVLRLPADSETVSANSNVDIEGFTATGTPTPQFGVSGTMPEGLALTDNEDGTASLVGRASVGSEGTYPLTVTAYQVVNGVETDVSQPFTLVVTAAVPDAPAILTGNSYEFLGGPGQGGIEPFTVYTNLDAYPTPTISATGLPACATFTDNGDDSATMYFNQIGWCIPGVYDVTITASNGGVTPDAVQAFTLTVDAPPPPPPTISSNTCFGLVDAGFSFSCSITAAGTPTPTLTTSGWPTGLKVTQNGATVNVSGVPTESGDFPITVTASNANGNTDASFSMYVGNALEIYNANSANGKEATSFFFVVETAGLPHPSITESGALPTNLTFTDLGNGYGLISGTPAVGTAGLWSGITFTAHNGVSPDAVQDFSIQIAATNAAITSASSATAIAGHSFTFGVTTYGSPVTSIKAKGLPPGVTLVNNGNGTATISGVPSATDHGPYAATVTADVAKSVVSQTLTISVDNAPAFKSKATDLVHTGTAFAYAVTTAFGDPVPTITTASTLPGGVTLTDNHNGTADLAGNPEPNAGGVYPITITASNGIGAPVNQSFVLTVYQSPAIATIDTTTITAGVAMTSVPITVTGYPEPKLKASGLPAGIKLTAGSIAGTTRVAGTYPVKITASSKAGSASQTFTLVVNP